MLLGLFGFCDSMPRLLLGAIGGALTDRFERRRLVMLTQVLGMCQATVYWLVVFFDLVRYWHVLVLAGFLGVVNTMNQTARQSLVNDIVAKEDLANAIALHSSTFNLSRILGPSIGGLVIALIGVEGCFLVNALSFLALIFTLGQMALPPFRPAQKNSALWDEVKEGFAYLRGHSQLFAVMALSYVVATIGAPYATFVPTFATNVLHVGATGFGLLAAAPGIGATTAGLWLASQGDYRPSLMSMCGFVVAYGLLLACLPGRTILFFRCAY